MISSSSNSAILGNYLIRMEVFNGCQPPPAQQGALPACLGAGNQHDELVSEGRQLQEDSNRSTACITRAGAGGHRGYPVFRDHIFSHVRVRCLEAP